MLIEFSILSVMTLALIASGIFQWQLRQFIANLPGNWRNSAQFRNIRVANLVLFLLLLSSFITAIIAEYLASKGIYNHYIFSFDFTFSTLFLFSFFFVCTRKTWKRATYFLFYVILVGYLIQGGYYHPKCILPGNSNVLISSMYFLAALLQLTDLLLENRLVYFRFYLKTNLSILIYSLISIILTSALWAEIYDTGHSSDLIYYLHVLNIGFFYASLIAIFISETLKLRRG